MNFTLYKTLFDMLSRNSQKLDNISKRLTSLESRSKIYPSYLMHNDSSSSHKKLSPDELDKYKEQIAACLNHEWNVYRSNYWKHKKNNKNHIIRI